MFWRDRYFQLEIKVSSGWAAVDDFLCLSLQPKRDRKKIPPTIGGRINTRAASRFYYPVSVPLNSNLISTLNFPFSYPSHEVVEDQSW